MTRTRIRNTIASLGIAAILAGCSWVPDQFRRNHAAPWPRPNCAEGVQHGQTFQAICRVNNGQPAYPRR